MATLCIKLRVNGAGESMMCEGVRERRALHALYAPCVRIARAYIP